MTAQAFRRVAIVNRGEPAMRLIHAVREWNAEGLAPLRTIAIHTAVDRIAMFVREADEAVLIGPDDPEYLGSSPYLDYAELRRALTVARADAVWPGWGFVSEKAEFARLCRDMGIVFVGPSPEVMDRLGDKIASKLLAEEVGVPMAAWSNGPVADIAAAREHAARIGYPLMVKATAGGGGRGIRKVERAEDLDEAFERASSEAAKTAGDATMFLERAIAGGRHVEVQVVADATGDVWTLGVRDCSVQRRNQKVIEESASTALDAEQEQLLRTSAAALVKAAGYVNAGTVEFLYEPGERLLSFLEVNTRLQVEHPVTEVTTGTDIVKLQLHVAGGGKLSEIAPETPQARGWAIEARLTAEDPEQGFAPAPGRIEHLALPSGPGVRVDTGVASGDVIPPQFDSMIAKVIAWGRNRGEARARLSPRAAPDRRRDRGRQHEQGVPARPARPARGALRRGRHHLARHDDGRWLHPAAAHRRRAARHGGRGAGRARRPPARAPLRLRRARAPRGGARGLVPGGRAGRRRVVPAAGGPVPRRPLPRRAGRQVRRRRSGAHRPLRAQARRRRHGVRRAVGAAGQRLPHRGRRRRAPHLRRRGGHGPRARTGDGRGDPRGARRRGRP